MTIFFDPRATLDDPLLLAVGGHVDIADGRGELDRILAENPDELLVVIGPSVDLPEALSFASTQRIARPALGVVVVRNRVDSNTLAKALRAGVREVVRADQVSVLAEACRLSEDVSRQVRGASAAEAADGGHPLGQLITVFSAKGGCGKTTIATNIAAALSAKGARQVCLVDLDLAFGDVAIAMQLFPERSIADAVSMSGKIDEAAVRMLLTPHGPGLDTLLAPLEPSAADGIPAEVVAELLRVLKTMYDYVVVDSPPAFTDHVLAAFDQNDHFLLVATLDIPALKNLKLTLEMLDLLGYPRERWHLVLNRSDSKVGLSASDVEKTMQMPIAALVPSSREVSASINRGVPIVLELPTHPVSVAIRLLAESRIASSSPSTHPRPVRTDRRGAMSLLRRGGIHA